MNQETPPDAPGERYWPLTIHYGWPRRFPAVKGSPSCPEQGILIVGSGDKEAEFRLHRIHTNDEDLLLIACVVRLVDADGITWEAVSRFSHYALLENMNDIMSADSTVFFEDAQDGQKAAFATATMISGARCMMDDAFYLSFLVGNTRVDMRFKCQTPHFDIAYHTQHGSPVLLTRITDLVDLNVDKVPPLLYQIELRRILFRNDFYFNENEGYWDSDEWSIPVEFQAIALRGEPQSLVRFEPHQPHNRS